MLTIIVTAWLTMSILHVAKEKASPYSSTGLFLLIEFILAPYLIVSDLISEYKDWQKIIDERKKSL